MPYPWEILFIERRRKLVFRLMFYPRLESKWENHLIAFISSFVKNRNLRSNLCPLW